MHKNETKTTSFESLTGLWRGGSRLPGVSDPKACFIYRFSQHGPKNTPYLGPESQPPPPRPPNDPMNVPLGGLFFYPQTAPAPTQGPSKCQFSRISVIFQIWPMWPYTRPIYTPLITNINVPLVIGAASHEAQALQTPRITFGCLWYALY